MVKRKSEWCVFELLTEKIEVHMQMHVFYGHQYHYNFFLIQQSANELQTMNIV